MTEQEQTKLFDQWLGEHKGIFFKIVRAYAFTAADQDDLFQEVALQVWRSVPDFRGESKVSTWIYRVALYTASTWVRQEKKQVDTRPLADMEHVLSVTDHREDGRVTWLYEQISQLDPTDRSICLLMLEGFSYKEIAEITGVSSSHVGVKIHRIKRHLTQKSREKIGHGL